MLAARAPLWRARGGRTEGIELQRLGGVPDCPYGRQLAGSADQPRAARLVLSARFRSKCRASPTHPRQP
eukprot:15446044-Alexandrium_andersonii.AAC.1